MVMDVTGMIEELRLVLDRIERSILILETFACPGGTKPAVSRNRGRGSPDRRPAPRVPSRRGQVVSIARGSSGLASAAGSPAGAAEEDLYRRLHELRSHTSELQTAILLRKPHD